MEIAVPAAELVESPGRGSNGDAFVLHPYLYPHALLKVPHGKNGSLKKSLGKLVTKGGREKEGENYLAQLEDARHALRTGAPFVRRRPQQPQQPQPPNCHCSPPTLTCPSLTAAAVLESPSVGDQAVSDAAASYIGLLLGLVSASGASSSSGKQADAAAAAASPDEALEAAESGAASGSSTASPLSAPPSKLRMAGQYEWSEAVLSPPAGAPPRKAASSDALFELASALVAVATRLMHAAALACLDSPSGVATPASTRGYKLLREAAGMLEFAAREVLPALPAGLSADCDLQVVRALATAALADAQQLTVLRAVAKGNQPALIASLAADTAALYSQACSQVRGRRRRQPGGREQHCMRCIASWLAKPLTRAVCLPCPLTQPPFLSGPHPAAGLLPRARRRQLQAVAVRAVQTGPFYGICPLLQWHLPVEGS
jgi:hypothetical protein